MTTAQDQQSRELLPCPFCGREAMMSHSRDGEVCNVRCAGWSVGNCLGAGPNCYTEADAVAGWNRRAPAEQAARALPAGMEPVARVCQGAGANIQWRKGMTYADLPAIDGQDLYTAAQVQAMGRVPPEWQAVPMESTRTMKAAGRQALKGAADCTSTGQAVIVFEAMCAAAPRPPAAQEGA